MLRKVVFLEKHHQTRVVCSITQTRVVYSITQTRVRC